MALTLVIGNKNYSSWSFRPWIAMKVAGIAFDEVVISLDAADFKPRVSKISGTGKVPALDDDGIHVWESLAILEYLAERFPAAQLWPADPAARAHARAISSEMHAGFVPLRRACPMNMWRPVKKRELNDEAVANVRRIEAMWTRLPRALRRRRAVPVRRVRRRRRHVCAGGGALSHLRCRGRCSGARLYGCGMALPAWAEWKAAALKEPWVLAEDEVDWPQVLKV